MARAARIPLAHETEWRAMLPDDFGDSPRDRVLATLSSDATREQSPEQCHGVSSGWEGRPALPLERVIFPPGGMVDVFSESPRDGVHRTSISGTAREKNPDHFAVAGNSPTQFVDHEVSFPESVAVDFGDVGRGSGSSPARSKHHRGSRKKRQMATPASEVPDAPSPQSRIAGDGTGMEGSADASVLDRWPAGATTVMLRNIPNRYPSEQLLAEILAIGFEGLFDFFYLPMDFKTKRNRGYSFLNFSSEKVARDFVQAFHMQRLSRYSSQKILEVSPAVTQGFEANICRFVEKDAQRIQNQWFRPMIFEIDPEKAKQAE